eukprot:115058_1
MLQTGLIYEFIMNFKCDGIEYECDINTNHLLIYEQSDIICKIGCNDVILNDYTFDDLKMYKMQLNGALFSYDPDNITSSNHLRFKWKCMNNIGNLCDELTWNTISDGIVDVNFNTLVDSSLMNRTMYEIMFVMDVYDDTNVYRSDCNDSLRLIVYINNNSNILYDKLIISIMQISDEINREDKVRIVANVINNNIYNVNKNQRG